MKDNCLNQVVGITIILIIIIMHFTHIFKAHVQDNIQTTMLKYTTTFDLWFEHRLMVRCWMCFDRDPERGGSYPFINGTFRQQLVIYNH